VTESPTPIRYRMVEVHLFDTCTHKCAYCHYAETGKVLDASQIKPYKDPAFIDRISAFFTKRTTDDEKWHLNLTGGEPMLMPNLPTFVQNLASFGNKVSLNTAMLVGETHPTFRFLLDNDAKKAIDYLMISFHPEAENIEDIFFRRLHLLKNAGHSVIFRFVGHPQRLHRLNELSAKCREIDVAFHPTCLFSPDYPAAYTAEEKQALLRHAISKSQVIGIEGGIDTVRTLCTAGSDLVAIDMRTGNITPCISVQQPVIGNLYDDWLTTFDTSIRCPSAGISCICDIHFQQNVVIGADDRENFAAEKKGFVAPKDAGSMCRELTKENLRFSAAIPKIGQTETVAFQSLDTDFVKAAYQHNKVFYEGDYSKDNHPAFRSRQFG
jgi:organic radical activating enzyme